MRRQCLGIVLALVVGCVDVPAPVLEEPASGDATASSDLGPAPDRAGLDAASSPDGQASDEGLPDARLELDQDPPDAAIADAAIADAAIADAAIADAAIVDAEAPDLGLDGRLRWVLPPALAPDQGDRVLLPDRALDAEPLVIELELRNGAAAELRAADIEFQIDGESFEVLGLDGGLGPGQSATVSIRWTPAVGLNTATIVASHEAREATVRLAGVGYRDAYIAVGSSGARFVRLDGADWGTIRGQDDEVLRRVVCGGRCTLGEGPESESFRLDARCVALGERFDGGQAVETVLYVTQDGAEWDRVTGGTTFTHIAAGEEWYAVIDRGILSSPTPETPGSWRQVWSGADHGIVDIAADGRAVAALAGGGMRLFWADFPEGEPVRDRGVEALWGIELRAIAAADGGELLAVGDQVRRSRSGPDGVWSDLRDPAGDPLGAAAIDRRDDGSLVAYAGGDGQVLTLIDGEWAGWGAGDVASLAIGERDVAMIEQERVSPVLSIQPVAEPQRGWTRVVLPADIVVNAVAAGRLCQ